MGRSGANDHRAFPALLTTLSGLLTVSLGSVVILGWYIQSETLIQISPLFVPMQFNTASAFLLCGVGLLSALHFNTNSTGALGVSAGVIGFLTLNEYLLGVDFGIDQLFMEHYIPVETPYPGRMASNTALCFTLTGGALFMAGVPVTSRRSLLIISVLGSLVLGLGVIAFVGYVVNLETAYGWGHLGEMAVHTALGFVVLGIGMTAYAWSKEKPDTLGFPPWLPWSIGIGVLTITINLWQALEAAQEVHGHLFVLIFGVFFAGALSLVFSFAEKSRQGEQHLRTIFETSPIGISIVSNKTNKRLYLNPAMAEMFGAESVEKALEQDLSTTYVNVEDLNRIKSKEGDDFIREAEVERKRLDGTKWWCLLNRRPIKYKGHDSVLGWHYDVTKRKQAEEEVKALNEELEQRVEERTKELLESEKRLNDAQKLGEIGYWRRNIVTGKVEWSDQMYRVFGCSPETFELTFENIKAMFHPDDLEMIEKSIDDLLAGKKDYSIDHRIILPDKTIKWIHVLAEIEHDDQDMPVQIGGTLQDITERKQMEMALRQSEERLHRSVLYAPNPIMIHAEGGEVLMISKRWTELSGYAHSDIPTIFDWIDKAYGANRELMRNLIGSLYQIEEPFEDEAFITTSSGKQRVWDFRTAPLGNLPDGRRFVISMAVDVTERKKAEETLRDSEERFRSAFENVAVGNIVIDDKGIIEVFNSAAEKIFGYRSDEVIGENVSLLIPEPDQSNHNQYIRKYLETGKANIVGIGREVTGLRKNGEEFPMHLGVGEMIVGGIRSFVGSISDLTEIRILEAKLQQSQKMEAVGQLTGGIAHDFNNMLAVIVGNLELAQQSDSVRTDSQLIELITMAIDASDRAGALTDQLLSFSRQQTLSSRIIDVTEAVRDSLKLIRGALGADIEIETLLSKEALLIRIDPAMFGNALLNLTLNARDAMPEGGKLTIKTKFIELNRGQLKENPMRIHGLHALVSVSDTGVGIDKDNLDRVVEPFFTTKDVGEGSGLGLSMVYGFIEQSGGVMEINSEIGSGTEVAFYLPLVNEEDEKAQKKTEADSACLSEHREKVILVVEDDLSVLRTISRILMSEGYEVIEAVNGLSAGEILDEKSDAIDMVFSDVVMPGSMNGVQLAEWVRRKYKHIRVLLTSGYSDVANQTSSKAMKYEILNKPYKKDQLLKAIEESFNR